MAGRANPIGIHALVWTGEWDEAACRDTMRRTAEAGYDLVEVPLLDPASVDPDMTREVAAEHGLATTFSLGLDARTDVSSEDPDIVHAGRALLLAALEVAHKAGGSYLGGVIYSAMAKYSRPASVRGRTNAVATLRELAEAGRDAGVIVGLEPVNRYESNLVNTVDQALALIEEIDRPGVVVHLDSYHMNIEERDLTAPVRRAAEAGRLGYVHLGESHRGYLGAGSVDFPALFRALRDVSYTGPIVFESFSSAVVSQEFTAALGIWRRPWDDNVHLAAHARGFVEGQLAAAAANDTTEERRSG